MQLLALRDSMVRCRDRFRKLAPKRALGSHPVIGIVGEIFCRLTDLRLRSGVGFGGNRLTGLELSK